MRATLISALLAASLASLPTRGFAADEPALHRLDGFMEKGVFLALDRELLRHRFSQQEIEKEDLDGKPRPILDVVGRLVSYEKLAPKIEEPQVVRGEMRITLTPNSIGDEVYSTAFCALTYNGLALAGRGSELALVRPETQANLAPPKRPWNPDKILSTRLFRLGYLNSDAILRRYRQEIGTAEGHAILETKSNGVIVVDTDAALEKLGRFIDSEILEAMGTPAVGGVPGPAQEPRLPSPGAIASRDGIHFYLLAYARVHQIPTFGSQQSGAPKRYPEADLWMSARGFQTLEQEYRRVREAALHTRDAVVQGWVDPHPERTLTPVAQRRLAIRYGLVSPLPGAANAKAAKKTPRPKRP
jgi:hypothetical protein